MSIATSNIYIFILISFFAVLITIQDELFTLSYREKKKEL